MRMTIEAQRGEQIAFVARSYGESVTGSRVR